MSAETVVTIATAATLALGIVAKYGWPAVRALVKLAEAKPTLQAIADQFKGGNGKTLREVVDEIHQQGEDRSKQITEIRRQGEERDVRLANLEGQVESLLVGRLPRRKPDHPDPA